MQGSLSKNQKYEITVNKQVLNDHEGRGIRKLTGKEVIYLILKKYLEAKSNTITCI